LTQFLAQVVEVHGYKSQISVVATFYHRLV
jgi:hypothetical protein